VHCISYGGHGQGLEDMVDPLIESVFKLLSSVYGANVALTM
jgi:hypothetical protein